MNSIIFALLLLAPKTEPAWNTGHLVSMAVTPATKIVGYGDVARARDDARHGTYMLTVAVEMNGSPFIVDANYAPKLRWSHSPNVIENDSIQYRIKGHDLFILDNDKKEIKLRIVKTRKP